MASWRSTMAPPSARTAVSPLAVATGCFSAAIRAAKRLRCCEASSRLATAAVLSPSPGSATCCPEFRRTPSRGLVNYCPTAGNRSLVQPRSELRLYHSIHATGMRFTSRLLFVADSALVSAPGFHGLGCDPSHHASLARPAHLRLERTNVAGGCDKKRGDIRSAKVSDAHEEGSGLDFLYLPLCNALCFFRSHDV